MKRLIILILINVIIIFFINCKKNNPTEPTKIENPVPLKVNNYWSYGSTDYPYPANRTDLRITAITSIEDKTAYIIKYDVYTTLGLLISIEFAWQWQSPYFYEYEKSYGEWKYRKCFNYYSAINEPVDWGYYITKLTNESFTCESYSNCKKFVSTNKTNNKEFEEAIKQDVGFVMLSDDILKNYSLPKSTFDFLTKPKILKKYSIK